MIRSRSALVAALAAVAALMFTASASATTTFTVNSTADTGDALLDGTCDDGTAHCTLRAAIQEANNTSGTDTIAFDNTAGKFDGVAANATITLGSSLPNISDPAIIEGGSTCGTATDPKPCAAITGTGTKSIFALIVSAGGSGTAIHHLDFFNLNTGVFTQLTGDSATVDSSWFGIDLAESTTNTANHSGVVLNTQSNVVGGSTAAARNLFAQNDIAGVLVQSGDTNTITGNYFGAKRDGTAAAGYVNTDGVLIFGTSLDAATGNVIGGADTNSNSACDGACNLITNSSDDGIDIGPQSGGQIGASSTTIKGDYIGLALNGTDGNSAPSSSGHDGIDFGFSPAASSTTVGGTAAADRNYIGGNPVGIDTGLVADATTTIQNNFIGVQPDGTGAVANAFDNLDVSGTGGGSVKVLNNRIGGNGASGLEGIYSYGRGTVIKGNIIGVDTAGTILPFGANAPAIDSQGSTNNNQIGGTGAGDGNTIAGGGVGGIRLNGASFNTVQGNFIGTDSTGTANLGNTGPGVWVTGSPDSTVVNTIGGTTAAGENLISNNTGDAIRVTRVDGVQIQQNRGSGNGEQFIDLENPSGAGNNAPDGAGEGVQAPAITAFNSATQASGTSQPGATIRLFPKSSASDGELGSQLGTAIADGSGNWTIIFSAQAAGQRLAALQSVPGPLGSLESSELSPIVQIDLTPPGANPPAIGNPTATTPPTKKCKKRKHRAAVAKKCKKKKKKKK